jgi:putative flippase GtrA
MTEAAQPVSLARAPLLRHAPPVVRKLFGYILTGGAAAVVDAGGFQLLLPTHAPLLACAAISFCIAAIINYTLTSRYVFAARFEWKRFNAFLVFALIGLVINASVTTLAAVMLPIPAILAKLAGIGTAFAFNFLVNLLVVFRDKDAASQ